MTEITDETRQIIREALARRQEAEGAAHSAKLYRAGNWDENSAFLFARDIISYAAPLIEAAAIERCAQVAYNFPHYASAFDDLDEHGQMRPGSPYDRGRYDAARDIRNLTKET